MSFTDPQSVTIAAVATSLPRVSIGQNTSTYKSNDGLITLSASHAYGKRARRTLRLDHSKIAADPFTADLNARYSMSAYIVCDVPLVGYTVVQQKDVVDGFIAHLTAASGAQITKLLGGEN